jgi:prepilin peptidase CpaA
MYKPFFPTLQFAWGFLILLLASLAVASFVDQKHRVIPKWITVSLFVAGLLISIVRGAYLGYQAHDLWMLSGNNVWLGALDGFLFAVVGAAAGFGVMFVFWILGTCGGGDVKLFTALGAWLGPLYSFYVLLGSLISLFFIFALKAVTGAMTMRTFRQAQNWRRQRAMGKTEKAPASRISYSLPVAIATLAVLVWVFRTELHLAAPLPEGGKAVANSH